MTNDKRAKRVSRLWLSFLSFFPLFSLLPVSPVSFFFPTTSRSLRCDTISFPDDRGREKKTFRLLFRSQNERNATFNFSSPFSFFWSFPRFFSFFLSSLSLSLSLLFPRRWRPLPRYRRTCYRDTLFSRARGEGELCCELPVHTDGYFRSRSKDSRRRREIEREDRLANRG